MKETVNGAVVDMMLETLLHRVITMNIIAAGDVKLKPKDLKWKAEDSSKTLAVVAVVVAVVAVVAVVVVAVVVVEPVVARR